MVVLVKPWWLTRQNDSFSCWYQEKGWWFGVTTEATGINAMIKATKWWFNNRSKQMTQASASNQNQLVPTKVHAGQWCFFACCNGSPWFPMVRGNFWWLELTLHQWSWNSHLVIRLEGEFFGREEGAVRALGRMVIQLALDWKIGSNWFIDWRINEETGENYGNFYG